MHRKVMWQRDTRKPAKVCRLDEQQKPEKLLDWNKDPNLEKNNLRQAVMGGRVHTAYRLDLGNRKRLDCVKSGRKKMKEIMKK